MLDGVNFGFLFFVSTMAAFAAIALTTRAVSIYGTTLALAVGSITYFLGGFWAFFAVLFFYAVAETATRMGAKGKMHEQRGAANVLGNTLPAMFALAFSSPLGFYAGISSAFGDTFSSEVGKHSKSKPRMITNFSLAEHGTDGAISLLGSVAGILASLSIALLYGFGKGAGMHAFAIVFVCGVAGIAIDSVLGATLQKRGILDNNQVNLAANSLATLLAFALQAI